MTSSNNETKLFNDELTKIGLIVARLQVLHNQHERMIRTAIEQCDSVILALGSCNKQDQRNPMDFSTRKSMAELVFGNQLNIIGLDDINTTDPMVWNRYIFDKILDKKLPCPNIVYLGDINDIRWYSGHYSWIHIMDRSLNGLNATTIRAMIKDQNPDWRKFVNPVLHDFLLQQLG